MSLTDQDRDACYRAYVKIVNAMKDEGLHEGARFSLAGSVMSQIVQESSYDTKTKHRMIDEFAHLSHQIIDRN